MNLDSSHSPFPPVQQGVFQASIQERKEDSVCPSLVCGVVLVGLVAMVVIGSLSLHGGIPLSYGGGIALTVIGGGTLGTFALICCSLCCQCYHQARTFQNSTKERQPVVLAPNPAEPAEWTKNPLADENLAAQRQPVVLAPNSAELVGWAHNPFASPD